MTQPPSLTNLVLDAYREGVFPMAEDAADDTFAFYKPHQRALIPIAGLHIPRRLLKTLKQNPYTITMDTAFKDVINACMVTTQKRSKTWINHPIRDIFLALHYEGHAHSIECWDKDGVLVGGLYGLAIGSVFCGESMFSTQTDASKIALVYLCALLWKCGFNTLDTQFVNPHLLQFGVYEIPQEEYEGIVETEMKKKPRDMRSVELSVSLLEEYLASRVPGL